LFANGHKETFLRTVVAIHDIVGEECLYKKLDM
jgi:hypothetical protein